MIFILGPCVIESEDHAVRMAEKIKRACLRVGVEFFYKASFDKANRSAGGSYRGPGLERGLEALQAVKDETGCRLTTDIHEPWQAERVARVVDLIQIPALLSRQSDLLAAAAGCGLPVNVKKGQFAAPGDMGNVVAKLVAGGCRDIYLTERGTTFGYRELVVDMRSFAIMKQFGATTIFDASHSVQTPCGEEMRSGGSPVFSAPLALAAVAAGADGVFCEVHDAPDRALCDGPSSLPLAWLDVFLGRLAKLKKAIAT